MVNNTVTLTFDAVIMQVLQLKVTIGNLVMAMIEENSVESLVVAKVCRRVCSLIHGCKEKSFTKE